MRRIVINNINGILNQLLSTNQTITSRYTYLENDFLDINSWFWCMQLDKNLLYSNLKDLKKIQLEMPYEIRWAICYPDDYISLLQEAKNKLGAPILDPQILYKYLEILQIACYIRYYSETYPFKLDICTGFIRSSDSSKELYEDCTYSYSNPYLSFLKYYVLPVIKKHKPEIIWLTGKPNIVSFSIAALTREIFPDIYIGIAYHSSEYYSLTKILPYLEKNQYFFKSFNIVALDDFENTIYSVESALEKHKNLSNIPNLIYSLDYGKTINKTAILVKKYEEHTSKYYSSKRPIDIKLFPNQHCFWNKCTFCGINSKYLFTDTNWTCNTAFETLENLYSKGIKSFWCIDEAIPGTILKQLAQRIIKEKWDFKWHVRTRIENNLADETLCKLLKSAGLNSILLGFESASESVLRSMNKTVDINKYVQTAEDIVRLFNREGISVHFPAIIGFPTETVEDRNRTIRFLEYLKTTYPLFSYNINIFELDISSTIYQKFATYNISVLQYPCPPFYFLGNTVEWGVCNRHELETIQHKTMRKMFTWYPSNSLLNITNFYKLLEHTRLPFWHKYLYKNSSSDVVLKEESLIKINKNVFIFIDSDDNYTLYNSNNFQYLKGGSLLNVLFQLRNWTSVNTILKLYSNEFMDMILALLKKLIEYNILISKEVK